MNDTHPDMAQKQWEIIMSKTPAERFIMGLEMMEAGRQLMIDGIKNENPGISEKEIINKIIKRQRLFDDTLSWIDELGL